MRPKLKITEIEIFPVSIPTITPYFVSSGTLTAANSIVIRLHTDTGLYGIGDTSPSPLFSEESPQSVISTIRDYLAPAIEGMNPLELERVHQRMDAAIKANSFAKAAIGIALYDLLGKHFDVPAYQLMGGLVRDEFPLLWPLMGGDAETNVREAQDAMKRGYRSVMIKVGHNDPDIEVERVAAVRKTIGDKCVLIPDANQGWSPQVAIQCIRRMEPYNVAWVEQPVPRWDLDGMVKVREATGALISADESLCSTYDAMALVKSGAVDVVSVKLQKSEGLLKAKKIAAITEAANIPIFINSMIETGGSVAASLQFAASTPNVVPYTAALMSTQRLQDDILTPGSLAIDGPTIRVTDRPGLGIELDEAKLSKYAA